MEGKRVEVLAAKAKARDERNKGGYKTPPNSAGTRHDHSGRAYIVDSETGEAILLATSAAPDVALASLTTDPIPKDWYSANEEYLALLADDASASIDWREKRRSVDSNALLASSPKQASLLKPV